LPLELSLELALAHRTPAGRNWRVEAFQPLVKALRSSRAPAKALVGKHGDREADHGDAHGMTPGNIGSEFDVES
jgi:hypothetical protein